MAPLERGSGRRGCSIFERSVYGPWLESRGGGLMFADDSVPLGVNEIPEDVKIVHISRE